MTDFTGVIAPLAAALSDRGYTELTPVQNAVLVPELDGKDAIVSAQTGSGKTVAFGLAIAKTLLGDLEHFDRAKTPLALVVAPTRELALQVQREIEWLYAQTHARVASCVGGMDMRTERRALARGAHIVVGTPGRLRDHIERGSLDTSGMRAVVLDEADEMLDLGFRDDLEYILETTPEDRRTLMFSATVPRTIAHLAKKYQRDAVRISTAEEKKQHVDIEYRALVVGAREQENAIINVLRYYEAKNALVFCSTRASVNHMTSRFNNRGFSVVALSGELNQNQRTHALQALRDGRARVCIATDVAVRGLDLPNLGLVIHADLPNNSEALLHRSGRTGRAGRKGVSVLIVPQNRRKKAERLLGGARINAEWASAPSASDINARDEERLMSHVALTELVTGNEQALVDKIIAEHGAEQAAVAFV
ncbi:MAG: DEAD/DEAH box helicase, partial [Rhizobiales bacterium]|nr:DEAD/DEAH box helicase [Hyphomicrobiales bacterium]